MDFPSFEHKSILTSCSIADSYAYASDLQWLDDANFLNQASGSYGIEIEGGTMSVAGDATFTCSPTSTVSGYGALYYYYAAIDIQGNLNIQGCGGTLVYGYEAAMTIGGDWVNTNITCTNGKQPPFFLPNQELTIFVKDGEIDEGQVIVYGNFLVTDSTGSGSDCYFLDIDEGGMEVFGDFTFQNVKFSGSNAYFVYLDDYASLIIHGNTLFTNIHYEGTGGTPGFVNSFLPFYRVSSFFFCTAGIISYYSFLKTMGTFTMNNIFFNSTNGVSIGEYSCFFFPSFL